MKLFQIQDNDRPMWVLAESFGQAMTKWVDFIKAENPGDYEEEDPEPNGVNFIADDDEVIQ